MASLLQITILLGAQIVGFSNNLIQPWLDNFKEYPYLFQGSPEGGVRYFTKMSADKDSMVVLATVNGDVAGFLIGIPLLYTNDIYFLTEILKLFPKMDVDPTHYYYITDIIVLPAYRNQGIAKKLFVTLEEKLTSLDYTGICLGVIEREENHPLKPANYVDLKIIWQHLGFEKTLLQYNEPWLTIIDAQGTTEFLDNPMNLWVKDLAKK